MITTVVALSQFLWYNILQCYYRVAKGVHA